MLGEASHYHYATIQTKTKMLNYLIMKEISSVALEDASFLSSYVYSNPEYSDITKNWKVEYFWGLSYMYGDAGKSLVEMINKREIKIWGIDVNAGQYDITSVKALLNKYLTEFPLDIDWDNLELIYFKKFLFYDLVLKKTFRDILSINEQ
jgi:hypothetical protein